MKQRLFRSLAVFLWSVTVVCTVCIQKLSLGDVNFFLLGYNSCYFVATIRSSGQIEAVSMHLAY